MAVAVVVFLVIATHTYRRICNGAAVLALALSSKKFLQKLAANITRKKENFFIVTPSGWTAPLRTALSFIPIQTIKK